MIWNHELIWNREMIWNHELIWNREIIWNCEMIFIFLKIREFFISSSFFFRKCIDFVFDFLIWNRFNSFLCKMCSRFREKKCVIVFRNEIVVINFRKKIDVVFFRRKNAINRFFDRFEFANTRWIVVYIENFAIVDENFAIVDELNNTNFSNFNNESINWIVSKIVFVVNDRDFVDFWN